jgi:hypothetical protein
MGDVIDRVPWWVVALFGLCVVASWHPTVRFAKTDVREAIGVGAFFLVVGSMATDSPGLVTASGIPPGRSHWLADRVRTTCWAAQAEAIGVGKDRIRR